MLYFLGNDKLQRPVAVPASDAGIGDVAAQVATGLYLNTPPTQPGTPNSQPQVHARTSVGTADFGDGATRTEAIIPAGSLLIRQETARGRAFVPAVAFDVVVRAETPVRHSHSREK